MTVSATSSNKGEAEMNKKYKRITKAVVQEAFPQIEWGNRS